MSNPSAEDASGLIYECKAASLQELDQIWDQNIAANAGDLRWRAWKTWYIEYNQCGKCRTFVVLCDGRPVGEGTLLFSPECGAGGGNLALADGQHTANVNALRIEKAHEGKGHISRLVRMMERHALEMGYKRLTIGAEAKETRNLGIYLHWGFDTFVSAVYEEEGLVLYYSKAL